MASRNFPGPEHPWRSQRRYPRVPILTPVDIYTKSAAGTPIAGCIHNVSLGGVLASCRESFDLHSELAMLFQIPTRFRIHVSGRIIYSVPQGRFGVAFTDLDQEAQHRLQEFTDNVLGHVRRSIRVPYRTHLLIRSSETALASEEPADTVLVSKNGGLLVCRAIYQEGQQIYLWSPERQCGISARVVFQQVWADGRLVEVGFEFLRDEDFWKMDFAPEYD